MSKIVLINYYWNFVNAQYTPFFDLDSMIFHSYPYRLTQFLQWHLEWSPFGISSKRLVPKGPRFFDPFS